VKVARSDRDIGGSVGYWFNQLFDEARIMLPVSVDLDDYIISSLNRELESRLHCAADP